MIKLIVIGDEGDEVQVETLHSSRAWKDGEEALHEAIMALPLEARRRVLTKATLQSFAGEDDLETIREVMEAM